MTYERPVLSLDAKHSGLPVSMFSPYPRPLFMWLHLLAFPQSTFQRCHCSPPSNKQNWGLGRGVTLLCMRGGLAFPEAFTFIEAAYQTQGKCEPVCIGVSACRGCAGPAGRRAGYCRGLLCLSCKPRMRRASMQGLTRWARRPLPCHPSRWCSGASTRPTRPCSWGMPRSSSGARRPALLLLTACHTHRL